MKTQQSITVSLNGQTQQALAGVSLKENLKQWQPDSARYAIAINEEFIPESQYDSIELSNGDRIELLVPMQGG
ncbi:sulfur carrier protein ThiS [Pleionea sp. CnH1-48]|uniref:sulfur carrier protein ThiS n=1 Tax=Pleionea sp. CnH1-48 TaxID=2954494 RepID=UPI0020976EA2|nr:sulfur carrier protein ThiS [Pleionea sp. CnH1-48]MCO7223868.1 sulfur carrier protein ThiS [Pleionea sp. CnH1-48]